LRMPLDGPADDANRAKLRLWQQFIIGRTAMTALFMILLMAINGLHPDASWRFLFLVSAVQFAVNGAYLYLWRVRDISFMGYLAFVVEVAQITLLILALGPDGYIFLLGYLWPIILGSWLIGHQAASLLTFLSALAYTGLFLMQRQSFYIAESLRMPDGTSQAMILSLPYLAFTAVMVWYLAVERERADAMLKARNQELLHHNKRLTDLVGTGETLLADLDRDTLWRSASAHLSQLLGPRPHALYSLQDQRLAVEQQLDLPADRTPPEISALPNPWRETMEQPTETLIFEACPTDAEVQWVHTALGTPQSLEGVVSVGLPQNDDLDPSDLRVLRILAHQLSTALANSRLVGDLERERNVLQSILSTMVEAVFVADSQSNVLLANQAATSMLDIRPDAPLPTPFAEALSAANAVPEQAGRPRLRLGERIIQLSLVDASAENGLSEGTLYVARDITQEAQAEQLKADFLNYASHEMRTPLTTIKMLVSLMRRGVTPEKGKEYLGVIASQVDRQTRLVNDLLDMSRLEAGKYELPLERFVPGSLATAALESCRPLASDKRITLEIEHDGCQQAVYSGRSGIETVLINLIGNAIKYTPEGGRVMLRCRHQDGILDLAVSDTGIGMTHEQMGRLFTRFYRAHASSKRGEGIGLGLVISQMIVHQLGGDILVESTPGAGSCFTVRLPISEPVEADKPATPAVQAEPA